MQIATVEQRRKDVHRTKFGDADAEKDLSPVAHAAIDAGPGKPDDRPTRGLFESPGVALKK